MPGERGPSWGRAGPGKGPGADSGENRARRNKAPLCLGLLPQPSRAGKRFSSSYLTHARAGGGRRMPRGSRRARRPGNLPSPSELGGRTQGDTGKGW